MSEPAKEIMPPGATGRRTSSAPASTSVSSTITTASAPRGITPPVAIVTASPGCRSSVGATPQASSSRRSVRRRGAASLAP